MAFTETIEISRDKVITTLTEECLMHLHSLLSKNYESLPEMEPVSPPGVKDAGMLGSAVMRQTTGSLDWYKYSDSFTNCATLVFGIIKNHAFFNGNKRVGLLALIKHLYVNGYVLNPSLKMDQLYALVVSIADNSIIDFMQKHDKKPTSQKPWNKIIKALAISDEEIIAYLGFWLRRNSISKDRSIGSSIKCSDLRKILDAKNIKMSQEGAKIILWQEKGPKLILGIPIGGKTIINKKEYSLGNDRSRVQKMIVEYIRRDFSISSNDGLDTASFLDDSNYIDDAILKYKRIIYKLSRT